ncbi:MAG: tyrosine--tRNA ligase [Bacteroidales bacterium]|jgi:tyrosyl-tRNA synthetase|nr:tyrosine--tRNA ligase [Bacteroidales bacterium]
MDKKNFIQELKWRGMVQDFMPGTEELLQKETVTAYVGIDPTADSLHIGHLAGIMMLKHLQLCGHKPLVLLGGATGMIGDPSGKSQERNLLSEETLEHNQKAIKKQLEKFLDFSPETTNRAEMVNNYDWIKSLSFLEFIRDVGKHITVNYMMAKDSVKRRITGENGADGMSFTEFTYQLVQGYDFYHLYSTKNCKLQMGGSDQWGNITTGTELIRRKAGGEAFALTCPLITKADGSKFGKTESGNVWLDSQKTSPYKFYQFWLNCSDEDSKKYIRIFTDFSQEQIESLEAEQAANPHLRPLQKAVAQTLTTWIHSKSDCEAAKEASEILFGNGTAETLSKLPEETLLDIFEGVPQSVVNNSDLEVSIVDFLSEKTGILASKSEARRALKENSISVNKTKITEDTVLTPEMLLGDKYLLVQRGKKNYFLVTVRK